MQPISLAQATLKILEKMLWYRLYWWIEFHHILPNSQFGFRKDKSCADNLAILSANIKRNQLKRRDTAAVFLDIRGAYDNVLCDVLVQKLKSINLSSIVIRFIYNLIHERNVTIRYSDLEFKKVCHKGLPQGSVLSPLLYSIYVSSVEMVIPSSPQVNIIQFADDICIFNSENKTEEAVANLEKCTNDLSKWLSNKGLLLVEHKTKLCVFSSQKVRKWSIMIDKTKVCSVDKVKFLGVIFQCNLKWNAQIEKISKGCSAPTNLISFLTTTWWGASPDVLLLLYKALIRSRIEYGAIAWYPIITCQLGKLNRIQY